MLGIVTVSRNMMRHDTLSRAIHGSRVHSLEEPEGSRRDHSLRRLVMQALTK
jgi:hypothetical protein